MKTGIIGILLVLSIISIIVSWVTNERAKELQLETISVIFMCAAFILAADL